MTDFNNLSPSSTSAPDETQAHNPPSNVPCTSSLSSPTHSENHVDPHETDPAHHAYATPWTCARSDTKTSSSCGSLSIFDNGSDGSLAESHTAPSQSESDCIITEDDRCSALSLPRSLAASVVATVWSTRTTLIEDTSSEDNCSSQSLLRHERHVGLPTSVDDDADEWSDNDTTTIVHIDPSQANSAELPIIVAPASSPKEAMAAEIKKHIYDQVGRYATREKVEGYSEIDQPMFNDSHSFEYHLKHLGRQGFQERYLAEDSAAAPWTAFHLRVRYPPLIVTTKH
jgi:hypothetical protein